MGKAPSSRGAPRCRTATSEGVGRRRSRGPSSRNPLAARYERTRRKNVCVMHACVYVVRDSQGQQCMYAYVTATASIIPPLSSIWVYYAADRETTNRRVNAFKNVRQRSKRTNLRLTACLHRPPRTDVYHHPGCCIPSVFASPRSTATCPHASKKQRNQPTATKTMSLPSNDERPPNDAPPPRYRQTCIIQETAFSGAVFPVVFPDELDPCPDSLDYTTFYEDLHGAPLSVVSTAVGRS